MRKLQINKRKSYGFLLFCFLLLITACKSHVTDDFADLILYAGKIITVNPEAPEAEAMAIKNGRIVAIGRADDVFAWSGFNTRQIDLEGKTVMPGFVEPHTHPMLTAILYSWVNVSGFTHATPDAVYDTLKEAVRNTPPGKWVLAFGWDPIFTPGLSTPTLEELDEIAPDNPLFILNQSLHTAYVNSRAFETAGITDASPNPPFGGKYLRDSDGKLTGTLKETAIGVILSHVPALPFAERKKLLSSQYERYLKAGYTTIGGLGLFIPVLDYLRIFEEVQNPPIRLHIFLPRFHEDIEVGDLHRLEHNLFKIIGIKYWYDGSPYTGTMLLKEPYLVNEYTEKVMEIPPGSNGVANYTIPELEESLYKYHTLKSWQIAVHTEGDLAVHEVLSVYADLLASTAMPDHRYRLEHCTLFSRDDLKRAGEIGISPSFHLNHLYYFGKTLRDKVLGPERAARILPLASALNAKLRISMHCDSPMYPPKPFLLLRTATTRLTREGEVIGPSERISLDAALRGVTIDAAWQLFADTETGSLEVNKSADFVIVSNNPFDVPPEDLDKIEVLETYIQGKRVY